MIEAAIFPTFNARFSNLASVGKGFVDSPFFETVAEASHTAILGPRGSGKTTLLKMLTLPALRNWETSERNAIVSKMDYLAVYVPASITWSADYRSFSTTKLEDDVERLITVSLFRHNALSALLQTWEDASNGNGYSAELSHLTLSADRNVLVSQVRKLARAWDLHPETATLDGLKTEIRSRLKLLQRLSVEAAVKRIDASRVLEGNEFLTRHFFDDATDFIDIMQGEFNTDLKLALCFDELEIAPEAISSTILKAPRSIDQRLLIKFSAAPYVSSRLADGDPSIPMEQNDYKLVFLSSYSAGLTRQFSEALFRSIAEKSGMSSDPTIVLGRSFTDDSDGAPQRYSDIGSHTKKFAALYRRDHSFKVYADQKGLSTRDLSQGSEMRRAADVRKILWPVLIREEFLFDADRMRESKGRRIRSKSQVSDIYTGAGSIFAICEGNPRLLIGMLEPLVKDYAARQPTEAQSVRRSAQKAAIERTMASFFALLSTIPLSQGHREISSLIDLVDKVGMFFRNSVIGEVFNPDPVLSFHVDDKVDSSIVDLVGRGVNLGAFVTRTDTAERPFHLGEISGLKIRLSHIVAPRYRLPLIGGRTVNLSSILRRGKEPIQSTLFDLFGEKI
jgi:energy-coupling factor transporter ATP-binding protein EcfA2